MAKFWITVAAFIASGSDVSCGKNSFPADMNADVGVDEAFDSDADSAADTETVAGTDIGVDAIDDGGGDYAAGDASRPDNPNIAGVWTIACHSELIEEVDFYLNFFLFQDGTILQGAEGESEDAYCHGTIGDDGQVSLTMDEPCTGSTVTFTGVIASPTFISGNYSWEWIDAYGTPHHDEGSWSANPFHGYCSPYPDVAGDWALYRDGRMEYLAVNIKQTENAISWQSPDGCGYLGAFSLTSECNDLRIYRRCPTLARQTEVLFGTINSPSQMSGEWVDMDDTYDCPEIRSGTWRADRL